MCNVLQSCDLVIYIHRAESLMNRRQNPEEQKHEICRWTEISAHFLCTLQTLPPMATGNTAGDVKHL